MNVKLRLMQLKMHQFVEKKCNQIKLMQPEYYSNFIKFTLQAKEEMKQDLNGV